MLTLGLSLSLAAACARRHAATAPPPAAAPPAPSSTPVVTTPHALPMFRAEWRRDYEDGLDLDAVWGAGPSDIYAVGGPGLVLHSHGDGRWVQEHLDSDGALHFVTGTSMTDVWAGGDAGLFHSAGDGRWTAEARAAAPRSIKGLVASGGSLFALDGCCEVAAMTASAWTRLDLRSVLAGAGAHDLTPATALGSAAGDLYAAGAGVVAWRHADAWSLVKPTLPTVERQCADDDDDCDPVAPHVAALKAFWSSGPTDVYMVGERGLVLHSTGKGDWTVQRHGRADLLAIHGCSATDVWAVGTSGTVLRSRGDGAWTVVPTGIDQDVRSVYCAGPDDVYAAAANFGSDGDDQIILHFHE